MMKRLYRLLLRLLPANFRGDFGDAMSADVDGSCGRGFAFWWREIRGLVATFA